MADGVRSYSLRPRNESDEKAMENTQLMGGKNIVDHTNEQQRALEQRRTEIADQKRREREIQQKLEEKEESAVEMQDTYNSMQQEVEIKTKKLKKHFAKLQSTKAEIMDLQEEHSKERRELEQTQMELTRDLKLKMLIIENFIPVEDKTKVMSRAVYDEDEDMWKLKPLANKNTQTIAKRPTSALGNRRPVSEYARVAAAMEGNPRLKGENILMVELDMPNRTTRDYDGPPVAPRIQPAPVAVLQDETDINVKGQKMYRNGSSICQSEDNTRQPGRQKQTTTLRTGRKRARTQQQTTQERPSPLHKPTLVNATQQIKIPDLVDPLTTPLPVIEPAHTQDFVNTMGNNKAPTHTDERPTTATTGTNTETVKQQDNSTNTDNNPHEHSEVPRHLFNSTPSHYMEGYAASLLRSSRQTILDKRTDYGREFVPDGFNSMVKKVWKEILTLPDGSFYTSEETFVREPHASHQIPTSHQTDT